RGGGAPPRGGGWRVRVGAVCGGGGRADALAADGGGRDLVAAGLGREPGEERRERERAVLRHEVPPVPPAARHNLPAPLTSFVGREQDLAALEKLLGQARLGTPTGTRGSGKTPRAGQGGGPGGGERAERGRGGR